MIIYMPVICSRDDDSPAADYNDDLMHHFFSLLGRPICDLSFSFDVVFHVVS